MNIKKLFKYLLWFIVIFLAFIVFDIFSSPLPRYRTESHFFTKILPLYQKTMGLEKKSAEPFGFVSEDPKNLKSLRQTYQLDRFKKPSDSKTFIAIMHWVRDQFPHAEPKKNPEPQSFDGLQVLQNQNEPGYFCGTASQLLIQAIQSLGGFARRVQLRFTPGDQHAVVEVWADDYQKWIVLDPDYDVYFTLNEIPQNALELHELWAKNDFTKLNVESRKSKHNIYKHRFIKNEVEILQEIFQTKDYQKWDKIIAQKNQDLHQNARFSAQLLNYYSHVSYPLRTDWKSRPLKWWHPEGNHVQNSLVFNLDTMPKYDDFSLTTKEIKKFYERP